MSSPKVRRVSLPVLATAHAAAMASSSPKSPMGTSSSSPYLAAPMSTTSSRGTMMSPTATIISLALTEIDQGLERPSINMISLRDKQISRVEALKPCAVLYAASRSADNVKDFLWEHLHVTEDGMQMLGRVLQPQFQANNLVRYLPVKEFHCNMVVFAFRAPAPEVIVGTLQLPEKVTKQ